MLFKSEHRKIMSYIHLGFLQDTKWFSVGDVRKGVPTSTSSASRTMRRLVYLGLLEHRPKGAGKRNYRCARRWPADVTEAFQMFEYAKVLEI